MYILVDQINYLEQRAIINQKTIDERKQLYNQKTKFINQTLT